LRVTEGPDLDGDGLAEVAVASPGADLPEGQDVGVITVWSGASLAAGRLDLYDPPQRVTPEDATVDQGFGGTQVWSDRDGDGVDDLFSVWALAWVVSGADLRAGGDRVAMQIPFECCGPLVAWDDVDGDGAADWLHGDSGLDGPDGTGLGAVWAVADTAWTLAGLDPDPAPLTYGAQDENLDLLGPVALDFDGDGLRDVLVAVHGTAELIGSAAILAGASAAEGLLATVPSDRADVVRLDDLDGGGVEDLAFFGGGAGLCFARLELLAEGEALEPLCWDDLEPASVSSGGDVDGDGDADVWLLVDGEIGRASCRERVS
jgi:hypothetical protein